MTRFYGIDCFENCTPAFRRFWLSESMSIIKKEERLAKEVIEDDDEMYELVKELYGEDAAAQALYERKRVRDEMKEKQRSSDV